MKPFLTAVLILSCTPALYAGTDLSKVVAAPEVSPFDKGRHEIDLSTGYFVSPVIACGHRPTWNWVESNASYGRMLVSPHAPWGAGWLRGNWEFLGNVFGGGIVQGPGNYVAGGRVLMRYNFVQPDVRLVPFVQIGGGGLSSDAYMNQEQHLIGGAFEFTLVLDAGFRCFVSRDWAVIAVGNFQHVSNAGTAPRNQGANATGFNVGVGCFF